MVSLRQKIRRARSSTSLALELNAILAEPKFKQRLTDLGQAPFAGSPPDFQKLIVEETEKWAKVIRFSGAKPE